MRVRGFVGAAVAVLGMAMAGWGPASAMVDDTSTVSAPSASPTVTTVAARSTPSARRDEKVDSRRSVPAYLSSVSPDRVVRVFSVRFQGIAGERRLIAAKVLASQPSTTPDSALMAAVSVTCSPTSDSTANAGATQNLVRGQTSLFTPRFVYRVPRSGPVACTVIASGLRPRPVASSRTADNIWLVDRGSYLQVSAPQGSWSRTVGSAARSRVLTATTHWTPVATQLRIGATDTFEVLSDHKVTTCSSVGGSRDSSTLGREMCAGHVSTQGTLVRTTVTAIQLTSTGRQCAPRQTFTQVRRVTPVVHHAMIFSRQRITVSHREGCTDRYRITGTLSHAAGAPVMVHAPSERLTVLP